MCVDVLNLSSDEGVPENFYDVILDKGCLDCLMSDPNDAEGKFNASLNHIMKSLKDNGTFYYITTGKPEDRINLLNASENIKFKMNKLGK